LDIGCNERHAFERLWNARPGSTAHRHGSIQQQNFASHFQPAIKVVYDFFSEKGARISDWR